MEHLEWTASYLRKIRKSELANALDRNRERIIERTRQTEISLASSISVRQSR